MRGLLFILLVLAIAGAAALATPPRTTEAQINWCQSFPFLCPTPTSTPAPAPTATPQPTPPFCWFNCPTPTPSATPSATPRSAPALVVGQCYSVADFAAAVYARYGYTITASDYVRSHVACEKLASLAELRSWGQPDWSCGTWVDRNGRADILVRDPSDGQCTVDWAFTFVVYHERGHMWCWYERRDNSEQCANDIMNTSLVR